MRVLGLFAKLPVAGQVKTRLASATSPEFAARVAEAFLRDTLARLSTINARHVVAFTPDDVETTFASFLPPSFTRAPQGDGHLGQRLDRFIHTQLDAGADAVVVIGADSPTLPIEHIESAFDELNAADLVLGPATDGGYYLIGSRRPVPSIFTNIDWSSDRVLEQTVAAVPANHRLALLPPWYDVDTLDDWRMLRGHLLAMRRAGLDPGAPFTERLVLEPEGAWTVQKGKRKKEKG